ncbi:hypothetical protein PUNSTDRAFT_69000, partial [Punctularia strigosozonata HHB-11173 SS5]|uniref:uncharacterized protein n=1 Tax=Punctularia strigosozonata (strain HHB-11173) TaxID=741275 RepID=UPI000441684A
MSLVLWIAIKVRGIPDLLGYVDDIFSYDESENMRLYRPYGRRMPRNQKRLLELWDELGIPHEDRKQVHGPILKIIGYEVDANKMSIGMGQDERKILVMQIRELAGAERVPQTQSYPLVELQQLAGSVNWAFNVFPLLRPGLTHLHQSMKGKTDPRELVSLSDAVLRDLIWVADHMERSRAIKLFKAVEW